MKPIARISSTGWNLTEVTMMLARVPSSSGALPIGPSLAWNGQTIAAGAPEEASHLPLADQEIDFTLAG